MVHKCAVTDGSCAVGGVALLCDTAYLLSHKGLVAVRNWASTVLL